MQTVLENPFIFHPNLTSEELSFKSTRPKERAFIPFAMVPRTIAGRRTSNNVFTFSFDYLIHEPAQVETFSRPVQLEFGKNSKKLLKIKILFKDEADIFNSLETARILIKEKKIAATKIVMKQYYNLMLHVLKSMEDGLREVEFKISSSPVSDAEGGLDNVD